MKGYQFLRSDSLIVGGAHPNYALDVSGLNKDEICNFLKDCVAGKKGEMAQEIKVAVVSFQNTPPGMAPYLIVAALPQTLNDNNSWGSKVVSACEKAATVARNAVLLNEAMDGVSCETRKNYDRVIGFLGGKSNVLALVDTNHNVKNGRNLAVGGGSASSIGKHCIDPHLFKLAKVVPKAIVRVEDHASDALPMGLCSSKVVEAVLKLESEDAGNALVSHMCSIIFTFLFFIFDFFLLTFLSA